MVDMAGSREVLGTLHGSLGDNMLKCLTVGMTHWDNEVYSRRCIRSGNVKG